MTPQNVFQIILIIVFAMLAFVVIFPRSGTRGTAIRRLVSVLLLLAGIVLVAFPDWLTAIANLLGIGRGTDLLLYALAVVFVGHLIASKQNQVERNRKFTELAREIAISEATPAGEAGSHLVDDVKRLGPAPTRAPEAEH